MLNGKAMPLSQREWMLDRSGWSSTRIDSSDVQYVLDLGEKSLAVDEVELKDSIYNSLIAGQFV